MHPRSKHDYVIVRRTDRQDVRVKKPVWCRLLDRSQTNWQKTQPKNSALHKAHQDDTSSVSKKTAFSNLCKTGQNRLKDMKDSWLNKKAEDIQSFADRKDMKNFHDALKPL